MIYPVMPPPPHQPSSPAGLASDKLPVAPAAHTHLASARAEFELVMFSAVKVCFCVLGGGHA